MSALTTPLFQATGSGPLPKAVVLEMPTTVPLALFASLATAKLRPARLGSATMPPAAVQLKACCWPVAKERPTTVAPSGETPKACEAVPLPTTPRSMMV